MGFFEVKVFFFYLNVNFFDLLDKNNYSFNEKLFFFQLFCGF